MEVGSPEAARGWAPREVVPKRQSERGKEERLPESEEAVRALQAQQAVKELEELLR